MIPIKENVVLAPLTTLGIGGRAEFFVEVSSTQELQEVLNFAKTKNLPVTIIGGGSNLLIADEGVSGLVIKIKNTGCRIEGEKVFTASGRNLDDLVRDTIDAGLGGLETLIDIPGTVGGAIYGNAGAYGRTISDFLALVTIFDGNSPRKLSREDCRFAYRKSVFKEKPWIILEAEFSLTRLHKKMLETVGKAILAHRAIRYPKGLKLPGSFFKNVEAGSLPADVLSKIPTYGVIGNKVQAGFLLESVGALGAKANNVRISEHHGNLFINDGRASAAEFLALAQEYWLLVGERFGVWLEPEVQLFGFKTDFFVPRG